MSRSQYLWHGFRESVAPAPMSHPRDPAIRIRLALPIQPIQSTRRAETREQASSVC